MSKITINPSDVIDLKSPLYKEDRAAKKVYRILPETSADQVTFANGQNAENLVAALEDNIESAQEIADNALSRATSALTIAGNANTNANAASETAATALQTANAAQTLANAANEAASVMQGATSTVDGQQGLAPKPLKGASDRFLCSDGTWKMPPDNAAKYALLTLYISKNGNDTNSGLAPEAPVLTIGKAIEIANAAIGNQPGFYVRLRIGAGNWGNITFENLPYQLELAPYDGNTPSAYSADLPLFGTLRFDFCFAVLKGVICDELLSYYSSYVNVRGGWKSINSMTANNNGHIYCSNNDASTDILEVRNSTKAPITVNSSGFISLGACTLKLMEDCTQNLSFLRLYDGARFSISSNAVLDMNGHTYAGAKLIAVEGAEIYMTSGSASVEPLFDDFLAKLPGSITTCKKGVIFNGGTITGSITIIDNNPNIFLEISNDNQKAPPDNGDVDAYAARIRDKNHSSVAHLRYQHYPAGNRQWLFQLMSEGAGGWRNLIFNVEPDGYSTLSLPTHPNLTENGAAIVDAYWVNSKLGAGASVATLAMIDEDGDNYVETFETRRQKAIAQINGEAQQAIYAGFAYEINGQDYFIGYSLFDQQNLANRAIIAAQYPGETMTFPCMDETGHNVWLNIPTETVLAIHKFGLLSHTDQIRQAADAKKTQIMAAETDEQLQAILAE